MKTLGFILGLGLLFASARGVAAKEVVFESSDGVWTDGTYESKGRDFFSILVGFEHYKMRMEKPELTLVRITPEPKASLFRSKKDKLDPKWKVPFAPSSGRAKTDIELYELQSARPKGEIDEAVRRAEAALAFWKSR